MHPGSHVPTKGDAAAVVMLESGEVVTYRQLDERSMRLARLFRSAGLRRGDHVALLLQNHARYLEVYWGAIRAGLYLTPINWHLKPAEAGYIVEDCGASAVVTSAALHDVVVDLEPHLSNVDLRLVMDGTLDSWQSYEEGIAAQPAEPLEAELEGALMLYSSGTTGLPKGIKPPLTDVQYGDGLAGMIALMQTFFAFSSDTVYLCPAPLYHSAPIGWSTGMTRIGGTVVVMESFDPSRALQAIEAHQVTHAQFVPTHFVRMLKLPDVERTTPDLSSLRVAVHAAAPCPVEVKRRMLGWWGPIVHEYYAGSEGNGFCYASPEDWLAHPGTVGKPVMGTVHVLDDNGDEVAAGETSQIWFESDTVFEYHNDADKTTAAFNDRGWSSLGDVGHVDADGFVYLTDRTSHMIISGGVNIYPQEVENELAVHPAIADVAIIGVPNDDFGEEVKAVVVASESSTAGPELADELIAYCRERIAKYKCPVTVDFVDALPRLPTGKLLKRDLRQRYWPS